MTGAPPPRLAQLFPTFAGWLASSRAQSLVRVAPALLVFSLALAVRSAFVSDHPLELYLVSNMQFLDDRARHLLAGTTTPTDTFTPVGYPAFVAALFAISPGSYALVGQAQALLGATTVLAAQHLTRLMTRSGLAGFLVGLGLALYVPLIVYTGFLLTETLFAFLVTLLAVALVRLLEAPSAGRAATAGGLLAAGCAVRSNLLLVAPLLAGYALVLRRRGAPLKTFAALLVAVALAAPGLGIVVAHNSRVMGKLTGLATNGGANFLLGHCECRGISFPPGTGVGFVSGHQNRIRYDEVLASPRSALDEGYHYARGLALFQERPGLATRALLNVSDGLMFTGFGELPDQPYYPGWGGHESDLRFFGRAFAWLVEVPALAFVAFAFRARSSSSDAERRTLEVAALLLASAVATLYLYLGDPRLRVPFDPLIAALAAAGWLRGLRCLRFLRGARPSLSLLRGSP